MNQNSGPANASEAPLVSAEVTKQLQSASNVLATEETTSKLQKKLENFHLPQRQHVILPHHIIVPDSEKNKFSFGSLGVNFGVDTARHISGPESEKSSTPHSEASQSIEETVDEQDSRLNVQLYALYIYITQFVVFFLLQPHTCCILYHCFCEKHFNFISILAF